MLQKVLFLCFLLFPVFASAQSVIINEIAWMGVPVDGVDERQWWRYEFLELFNFRFFNFCYDLCNKTIGYILISLYINLNLRFD